MRISLESSPSPQASSLARSQNYRTLIRCECMSTTATTKAILTHTPLVHAKAHTPRSVQKQLSQTPVASATKQHLPLNKHNKTRKATTHDVLKAGNNPALVDDTVQSSIDSDSQRRQDSALRETCTLVSVVAPNADWSEVLERAPRTGVEGSVLCATTNAFRHVGIYLNSRDFLHKLYICMNCEGENAITRLRVARKWLAESGTLTVAERRRLESANRGLELVQYFKWKILCKPKKLLQGLRGLLGRDLQRLCRREDGLGKGTAELLCCL